jgi:hypothetical protein
MRNRRRSSFVEVLESRYLLSSSTFEFNPPAGSPPHTLTFFLDSPTVPSGTTLDVVNADTGQSIATETNFTAGTWAGGASASFTFPDINGGVLAGRQLLRRVGE